MVESVWSFRVEKPSTGATVSLDFPAGLKGGTFANVPMLSVGPQPATDGMEIRLTTPEKGSRVVAITRTLTTATGTSVPKASFLKLLKDKYGEPSYEDGEQIAWLHDGGGKKVQVASFEPGTTTLIENGLKLSKSGVPTCWRQLSGAEYQTIRPLPAPYTNQAPQRPDMQDCSGGLYVRFLGGDELMKSAQFLLVDNRLLVEDRAAMDARVLREIQNAPKGSEAVPPKL